jgi:hypothetical protein
MEAFTIFIFIFSFLTIENLQNHFFFWIFDFEFGFFGEISPGKKKADLE